MKDVINKKNIIILLLIVIILVIIVFVMQSLLVDNTSYIVLDDYIIEYKNNTFDSVNYKDLKGHKFRMLHNDEYIGDYTFDHIDDITERLFFKNEDGVNSFNLPVLGLDNNINIADYKLENMTEKDFEIYKSLSENEVKYKLKDLTIATKITVDYKGKTINVCSIKYEGIRQDDDHSMLFVYVGDDKFILDEDFSIHDKGGYTLYSFEGMYVVDFNNDNKYELIVAKNHLDITDYSIYELDGRFLELYYTGK